MSETNIPDMLQQIADADLSLEDLLPTLELLSHVEQAYKNGFAAGLATAGGDPGHRDARLFLYARQMYSVLAAFEADSEIPARARWKARRLVLLIDGVSEDAAGPSGDPDHLADQREK